MFRRGISLLEVMLATVMLLAAVMALSRVAFLARRHAIGAEDRSQAQLLCQNILQELLAGARPLQEVSPEAFEGDNWVYMIEVEDVEDAAVWRAYRSPRSPCRSIAWTDETGRLPTEDEMDGYRLVHWMRTGKQPASVPDAGTSDEDNR